MKARGMGFTIFISIFFLAGLGMLGAGLRSFYRGRQALSWPTTEGQILESSVQEDAGGESTGSYPRAAVGGCAE